MLSSKQALPLELVAAVDSSSSAAVATIVEMVPVVVVAAAAASSCCCYRYLAFAVLQPLGSTFGNYLLVPVAIRGDFVEAALMPLAAVAAVEPLVPVVIAIGHLAVEDSAVSSLGCSSSPCSVVAVVEGTAGN